MSFPLKPTHDSLAAKLARLKRPGYSCCFRCGMPWGAVEGHTTWYSREPHGGRKGCFPLCEGCWELLAHPEARIEYYAMLLDEWEAQSSFTADELADIRAGLTEAVAAGL